MTEKIKGVVFWILVAAVVFYFLSQMYWPLFASAEVFGTNTFYIVVVALIIWRAYKWRHPKKKVEATI